MKKMRLLFILSGVVSSTFVCAGCAPEDPKLTALSVSTYPLKTTYEVGDMFDKTGMVVTGTYSNGSTREVNNYTYVPDGALELSDNMVVISSKEILTVLPITVLPKQKEAALTGIEISKMPTKLEYVVGETFDPTGMVVKAKYDDDSSVAVNNFTFSPNVPLSVNNKAILISYKGKTAILSISVFEAKKELDEIVLHANPNKVNYVEDDLFDPTGMVIVAKYTDGSQNTITNYSYSPTDKLSVSDNKIVVSYMGKTVDVNINVSKKVVKLENITITHQPNKVDYYVGDYFQSAGLKISASYSDGNNKDITGWSIDKVGKLTLDDAAVVVSYTEGDVTKTISIKISVTEVPKPVKLLSIAVTHQPNKVDYYVGEVFNPAGMEVTAYYDDGSKKIVTDYQYTPQGALSLIDKNITIGYEDKATTLPITVTQGSSKYQTGIEIVTPPTKTEYKVGEYFDKTGMVVKSTYNDGTGETITNYTYSPSGALTVDDKFITVKSGTFEAKQSITVTKEDVYLAAIYVKTQPNKTTYVAGENFNKTGMVVMAAYSDGSSKEITDYTISPETNLKTTDTKVTISYQGKTTTINITVTQQEQGYYASITSDMSGNTLVSALNSIISKNVSVSYDWSRYEAADEDPDNTSNIITIYARTSLKKSAHVSGSTGWNREHSFPQSKMSGNCEKDNHIIFASDCKVNGTRSNYRLGVLDISPNVVDSYGKNTVCKLGTKGGEKIFDPGDTIARGMVARATMYANVLYGLNVTSNFESYETLLQWHLTYSVCDIDLRRNEVVYQLQKNRNPFVDHPEYACKIWGTVNSETRKICGIN